jgi:Ca2+-binding RTX toxin-like protein
MTIVNASAATEALNLTLRGDQFAFAKQDAEGLNDSTRYSWLTTGGDGVLATGKGFDFEASPPGFGLVDTIALDFGSDDVTDAVISSITAEAGSGAIQPARVKGVTGAALDFFRELFSHDDTMTGSAFGDTFDAIDGDDTLNMGGGRDTAFGGAGNDTMRGGPGGDRLLGELGDDNLSGGRGNDVLDGGRDGDTLNGGQGADTLLGQEGDDRLTGGSANDVLDGGTGADTMNGGRGNDTYAVDDELDVTLEAAGFGIDRVVASVSYFLRAEVENLTLSGTAFRGQGNALANVITGNDGENTVLGLGGDDTLAGGGGDDILNGGTGADRMDGGAGDDIYEVDDADDVTIEAADGGVDRVFSSIDGILGAGVENLTLTGTAVVGFGNALANVITGNGANNTLGGFDGDDTVIGGDGNDSLSGDIGADRMEGGAGNDTYFVDNFGDVTIETADGGVDRVFSFVNGILAANVENLTLTGATAVGGLGNALANVITGNGVRNVLTGLGGDDTLAGGGGDDQLNGNTGADRMEGGAGNDTFVVDNAGDVTIEADDGGVDRVLSSVDHTLAGNVEQLTLIGAGDIDGAGNKVANIIIGNAQVNRLNGGFGNDTLNGRGGIDILTGGLDGDVFEFSSPGDSAVTARDLIDGFDKPGAAPGDVIDLSGIDAVAGGEDDAFAFLGANPGVTFGGSMWLADEAGETIVFGNVDGDLAADFAIRIVDGAVEASAYTVADFIG